MDTPLKPAADEDPVAIRRRARVKAAFDRAERDGLRIGLHARFAALAVLAFWTLATQKSSGTLFGMSALTLFAASGFAYGWLTTHTSYRWSLAYTLVAVDALLLSVLLVAPNPFDSVAVPPP